GKGVAMPELTDKEKSFTGEEVTAFERVFHREIPLSFKKHYIAENSGDPSGEEVEGGKRGVPRHGFNSIQYRGITIEEMVKRIERIDPEDDKFGTWAEFSYVPFAYDQGGNTIFLSLRDSDYGSIYWFTFQGPSIQLIASSFEEFRAKLYHMPVA